MRFLNCSLSTKQINNIFRPQEILSSKPLDWLFAQAIVDEKVGKVGLMIC